MKTLLNTTVRGIVLAVMICWSATSALSGKYNTTLDIGSKAPVWKDLPGTDGKTHSLDDLSDAKAIVVVFTCNSCPYAVDAEDRLNALVDRFAARGVAVVAINVNTVEEDLMPAMKERADEKGFKFPYLFDKTQQVAKDFGAKYTPEIFVFGTDRELVYMGSMDDSPAGDQVSKHYVADAVESVLSASKIEVTETVPIGCRIRFERVRRTRKR